MARVIGAKSFVLIGAAGYIAPRHICAIKEIGGQAIAALDRSDSVGILDRYFPNVRFFTEFERLDRYIDRYRREHGRIDYVSICSPNYLHDAHARFALRSDADAICEKPLVLNPWNIDGLADMERRSGRRINTILQLRLHPTILALRDRVVANGSRRVYDVDVTYITSRGPWYYVSWKGDESKSGGIATNIGVHLYDMLGFIFGPLRLNIVHHRAMDCAAGYLEYQQARVRWFLSINARDLPDAIATKSRTYRSLKIDGEEVEFSEGFTDLHTASYREIIAGRGFTLEDVRPSIETVAAIRSAPAEPPKGNPHPYLARVQGDGRRYQHGWPV